MKICIMRHGEAGFSAISDSSRVLTSDGINQSKQIGKWLSEKGIAFDLGLVSPYQRAQQTLAEVAKHTSISQIETNELLVPGASPSHISGGLMMLPLSGVKQVIVVSHLPLVGYLVNELCPDIPPPMFSTASIVCINLSSDGSGTVEWTHQPE